jgi:uncharacterized repeat protein (TIGR01451 family)
MTKKKKLRALPLVAMCLIVFGGAAALAQRQFTVIVRGRPEVKVTLSGSVERDHEFVPVEKLDAVHPGEIVNWMITSQNDGTGAAHEYKAVGHIPQGMTFVAGSATAEGAATVLYSIDGGQNFSEKPMIKEKKEDGSVKLVPAPASMYTQVRYEWSDPLSGGSKFSASYKVRVK